MSASARTCSIAEGRHAGLFRQDQLALPRDPQPIERAAVIDRNIGIVLEDCLAGDGPERTTFDIVPSPSDLPVGSSSEWRGRQTRVLAVHLRTPRSDGGPVAWQEPRPTYHGEKSPRNDGVLDHLHIAARAVTYLRSNSRRSGKSCQPKRAAMVPQRPFGANSIMPIASTPSVSR